MQIKNSKVLETYVLGSGNIDGELSINHGSNSVTIKVRIDCENSQELETVKNKIFNFLEKEIER